MPMLIWEQFLLAHSQRNNSGDCWFCVVWPERSRSLSFHPPRTCSLVQGWRAFGIDFYGLTFDILLLLSPVKNAKLLISFWITKFCSSLLKFWGGGTEKQTLQESLPRCVPFTTDSKSRAPVCAYMRFTPQDEDLCHHAEELVRVCIGAFEPVRSEAKDKWVRMWNASVIETVTLKIIPTPDAHIYPDKTASPPKAFFRQAKYQYTPHMLRYRHAIVVGCLKDLQYSFPFY